MAPQAPSDAPRPRAQRTAKNDEFAQTMREMLSNATSYRGAHARFRQPPGRDPHNTATTTKFIRDVDIGIDGVESKEFCKSLAPSSPPPRPPQPSPPLPPPPPAPPPPPPSNGARSENQQRSRQGLTRVPFGYE
jgi:hypothetical protein